MNKCRNKEKVAEEAQKILREGGEQGRKQKCERIQYFQGVWTW